MTEWKHSPRGRNASDPSQDRRRAERKLPSAIPSLKSARLVAGPEVRLINISRTGVLLQTEARLMPNSMICIKLVAADSIFLLKGRVVRSRAADLVKGILYYESAIAFHEEFRLLGDDSETAERAEMPEPGEGRADSPANKDLVEDFHSDEAILTVTASVNQSEPEILESLGANNW